MLFAGGAMLFEPGREGDWEEDARSRMLFWDGLTVAGFDAARAAARAGGAAELVLRLRQKAYPGVWSDPVCGIGYSPAGGRLAVIAPDNVVAAVADELHAIEGEARRE